MITAIPPGDRDRIRVIGRSQGYIGLPVCFTATIDGPSGALTPMLVTAWQPTPDELARLNAGASVLVKLINIGQHPPIAVEVSEGPEG